MSDIQMTAPLRNIS